MLLINKWRLKKRYAIGRSGILDSILQFLVKTFTNQTAKNLATSADKEIGKTALDTGKNLISKKLETSCLSIQAAVTSLLFRTW